MTLHWSRLVRVGGAVGGFFALKIFVGLLLVSASAHRLGVTQFVTFSQLFLFLALLATVSGGGVQGGLTRQVAIAGGDSAAEGRAIAAALVIWAGFAATLLLGVALFGSPLSVLLVDDPSLAGPLLLVTLSAVIGGAGNLLCAVLTGRGRAPLSLTLQGIGLIVSGVACFSRLQAGDPVGSVLVFAAGPIVTAILAATFTRDVLPRPSRRVTGLAAEARLLLAYSGAAVAAALLMPVTLFVLRSVYRESFGAEELGFWLAANRVSDVTSQLLGIYMGQIFLPQMARAEGRLAIRQLTMRTWALGTAVMGAGWLIFIAADAFFVNTFFSSRFLPAIPFISGYLLGDALRVSASMALHAAAARGRPWLSVGVEAGVAALIASYVLALTAMERAEAPWLGYLLAHATATLLFFSFGSRWMGDKQRSSPAAGPVGTPSVHPVDQSTA